MYPTAPEYDKHAAEHYPGAVPVSGTPNTAPPQPYAPPYIHYGRPVHGGAVKWSTGLCHCCDDPANCKDFKPHLAQSPISRNRHIKSCFIYSHFHFRIFKVLLLAAALASHLDRSLR